jgi:hypothetical protein
MSMFVTKKDHIAWINEIRVLDVRVEIPDIRPSPGAPEIS